MIASSLVRYQTARTGARIRSRAVCECWRRAYGNMRASGVGVGGRSVQRKYAQASPLVRLLAPRSLLAPCSSLLASCSSLFAFRSRSSLFAFRSRSSLFAPAPRTPSHPNFMCHVRPSHPDVPASRPGRAAAQAPLCTSRGCTPAWAKSPGARARCPTRPHRAWDC